MLKRASSFLQVMLHTNYKEVRPKDSFHQKWEVLPDVPILLRDDPPIDVFLRDDTMAFWKECIKVVDGDDRIERVCAVGSPGIGKTTTTAVLLKLLLTRKVPTTVVYISRTNDGTGWYFEFRVNQDQAPSVQMFSEGTLTTDIPSLLENETYFIIDPANFGQDVNPSKLVLAKVIINASPDSKHWGGKNFSSDGPDRVQGVFRYYPLWSLEELIGAATYISKEQVWGEENPSDWIARRYRKYGGVPRLVFKKEAVTKDGTAAVEEDDASEVEEEDLSAEEGDSAAAQSRGILALLPRQVLQLAADQVTKVETSLTEQPQSWVIGYAKSEKRRDHYQHPRVVVISEYVAEEIWSTNMGILWNVMLNEKNTRSTMGHAFECYVRKLMLHAELEMLSFECRFAVQKKDTQRKLTKCILPRCNAIRLCTDIHKAVRESEDELTVFHSVSEQFPLIDFCFKHEKIFYAVQVTIGDSHDSEKEKIKQFVEKLKLEKGQRIELIYAVPSSRLSSFANKPANIHHELMDRKKGGYVVDRVTVRVIGVTNPSNSQTMRRAGESGRVATDSSA
jgi:hypothetical protein